MSERIPTTERPFSPDSRQIVVWQFNELFRRLEIKADRIRGAALSGQLISDADRTLLQDHYVIARGRRMLTGKDEPLRADVPTDTFTQHVLLDPNDPLGPEVLWEGGIPVEGFLRSVLDREERAIRTVLPELHDRRSPSASGLQRDLDAIGFERARILRHSITFAQRHSGEPQEQVDAIVEQHAFIITTYPGSTAREIDTNNAREELLNEDNPYIRRELVLPDNQAVLPGEPWTPTPILPTRGIPSDILSNIGCWAVPLLILREGSRTVVGTLRGLPGIIRHIPAPRLPKIRTNRPISPEPSTVSTRRPDSEVVPPVSIPRVPGAEITNTTDIFPPTKVTIDHGNGKVTSRKTDRSDAEEKKRRRLIPWIALLPIPFLLAICTSRDTLPKEPMVCPPAAGSDAGTGVGEGSGERLSLDDSELIKKLLEEQREMRIRGGRRPAFEGVVYKHTEGLSLTGMAQHQLGMLIDEGVRLKQLAAQSINGGNIAPDDPDLVRVVTDFATNNPEIYDEYMKRFREAVLGKSMEWATRFGQDITPEEVLDGDQILQAEVRGIDPAQLLKQAQEKVLSRQDPAGIL